MKINELTNRNNNNAVDLNMFTFFFIDLFLHSSCLNDYLIQVGEKKNYK
jgi:hypothetical protein